MSPIKREVIIGDCRLLLGDSLQILPLLGKVDAVVTDPPYGVGLTKKTSRYGTAQTTVRPYPDDEATILPLVTSAISLAREIAGRVVVTPGTRLAQLYPRADSIGTIFSPGAGGRDAWGFGCSNPILYYGKCPDLAPGKGSRPNSFASYQANPYSESERGHEHPCPKPVEWMLWLVSRASLSGHTILDPFMCSGTTGVACVKLGRKFIGIEIDEGYFTIACERIRKAYAQPDFFVERAPEPKQEALL